MYTLIVSMPLKVSSSSYVVPLKAFLRQVSDEKFIVVFDTEPEKSDILTLIGSPIEFSFAMYCRKAVRCADDSVFLEP